MLKEILNRETIDLIVFVIAVLVNILSILIFLSRLKDTKKLEHIAGLVFCSLSFPITGIIVFNIINHREWWTVVLLIPILIYIIFEFFLDYILKLDFRNTKLIWPYLTLYYFGLIGLMGYSFGINKICGFVVLLFYFINLTVTGYVHRKKALH
ncbi:hypothetical protein ACFL4T_13200 [candidate division KSB1 bacterium]